MGGMAGWRNSQDTHTHQVCHLIWVQYMVPQNNYNSNVKDHLIRGFPGGAVVESLPANAGHMGSSPGLGRSHMPRSGWTREPQLLSLRIWSLCSATREAAIVRGPRTAMKSEIGRAHV